MGLFDSDVGWWVMAGNAGSVVDAGALALGAALAPSPGPGPGMLPGVQPVAVQSRVRCTRIVELDRSIAALTAERAALLVAERNCGEWKKAGYPSFEAWRGQVSGEGRRVARSQLTVATVLEESTDVAEAVASGAVTLVHAEVLGRARAQAERTSAGPLTSSDTRELVELAVGQDAETFARRVDVWVARRDCVAHDSTHEEMRRRRFLSVSHTATGTHLKGFLDVVAGQTLRIALEAAMNRPEDGDDRDYGQRCADALVDVAERAVNGGSLKGGALVRPHVSVIMTEATFVEARRELRRRAAQAAAARADAENTADADDPRRGAASTSKNTTAVSSADADVTATAVPAPVLNAPETVDPVTFEDGTPVPLVEVARILCDADLTRIVVGADDVPVNLGRTVRLYSREQRRAIIARDRGCRFAGCTKPARWCEIHHIAWWDRDQGETSLENGILLCTFHHHEVHRDNLTIRREPGRRQDVQVTRPRVRGGPAAGAPLVTPPGPAPGAPPGPPLGAKMARPPRTSPEVPPDATSGAPVRQPGDRGRPSARRTERGGGVLSGTLVEEPDWTS